jgi:hypothetical protein
MAALWTLGEAAYLVGELEPLVRELNYHTLLGGGVLHHGFSDKDLDLWFMPLNGYESDPQKVYPLLKDTFGMLKSIRDSPDYAAGEPYHVREMLYGHYCGKRIDLFIL